MFFGHCPEGRDGPITRQALQCGPLRLDLGRRTYIMGIVNVTPDSFSDGGRFSDCDAALAHARRLVAEGADIIDVGAESTRPGAEPVPTAVELQRLLPVVEALVSELQVPISIDTHKAAVADRALAAGAHMLNDVWGLQRDAELAAVAAAYKAPVVVMHNQQGTAYRSLMGDIVAFLHRSIDLAVAAGLPADMVIVDPGIGFGKTWEQNLQVLARLSDLQVLGRPILLGTSRKSFIGKVLDLPVDDRLEGTAATVALGILGGADIVRVHDVAAMVRVARMTDAVVRGAVA